MRFWLTVAVILGIAVLCVRSCAGKLMGGGSSSSSGGSVLSIAKKGGDSSPAPAAKGFKGAVGEAANAAHLSKLYKFRFREPPDQAALVLGGKEGIAFVVDKMSRMVLVSGTAEGVAMGLEYLEGIDVMQGSCAVQTWAVYVDKSAVKGWDLVAAIKSVVGSGGAGSLTIGNGGLTLDYRVGDIAAALDIICDGTVVYVIQRPHVQLLHGVASKIESLQEIPVPSTAVSQGISQSSVLYRKVGLSLEVTPYFLDLDRVRLSVVQSNGLLGQNVKIDNNQVPIIQSQMVSASVDFRVGQTVVLGGVSTLREETNKGWLRDQRKVTEGNLYVILSTYHEEPRAVPVGDPLAIPPKSGPPFGPGGGDAAGWLDAELPLLPSLGDVPKVPAWEIEEKRFIDGKASAVSPAPVKPAKRKEFSRAGH